jgi:hypothetical protein
MTTGEALSLAMIGGAAIVALFRNGVSREIALAMIAGVVANRIAIWGLPDLRYLAGAAILVSVGIAAIKRGLIAAGALLILSGLCYLAQEVFALPPSFGNPFLLTSELLWWLALLGVYRGRMAGLSPRVDLGYSPSRGGFLAGRGGDMLAKKAGK